jgi:hypothetical protein
VPREKSKIRLRTRMRTSLRMRLRMSRRIKLRMRRVQLFSITKKIMLRDILRPKVMK